MAATTREDLLQADHILDNVLATKPLEVAKRYQSVLGFAGRDAAFEKVYHSCLRFDLMMSLRFALFVTDPTLELPLSPYMVGLILRKEWVALAACLDRFQKPVYVGSIFARFQPYQLEFFLSGNSSIKERLTGGARAARKASPIQMWNESPDKVEVIHLDQLISLSNDYYGFPPFSTGVRYSPSAYVDRFYSNYLQYVGYLPSLFVPGARKYTVVEAKEGSLIAKVTDSRNNPIPLSSRVFTLFSSMSGGEEKRIYTAGQISAISRGEQLPRVSVELQNLQVVSAFTYGTVADAVALFETLLVNKQDTYLLLVSTALSVTSQVGRVELYRKLLLAISDFPTFARVFANWTVSSFRFQPFLKAILERWPPGLALQHLLGKKGDSSFPPLWFLVSQFDIEAVRYLDARGARWEDANPIVLQTAREMKLKDMVKILES